MRKKILIIGNEAKAYALAKKLSEKHDIYVTPSSDTLKEFATCFDIRPDNAAELLEFVMENDIDMTIPVTQPALKSNLTDLFNQNKQSIFAPSSKACEIIFNKTFAKKTLYKLRIPTPKFGIFEKLNLAIDYVKNQTIPFVIKTNDSNSATVITSLNTAKIIIESILAEKDKKVIIEDYIYGTPFTFYAITDGYKALPLGSSLMYKHSLEGDGGQLTCGMGAFVPNYKLSVDNEYYLMDDVIYTTLEYLQISGNPYLGILGVNGILTNDGHICILGWQAFTQDCDTDGIFNNVDEDLYNLFDSCIIGSFSDEIETINFKDTQTVSVVLSSKNNTISENTINGLDNINDNTIVSFYPSVTKNKYLEFEAKSGSVMVLSSYASSLSKAKEIVCSDIADIDFKGKYFRKDICSLR